MSHKDRSRNRLPAALLKHCVFWSVAGLAMTAGSPVLVHYAGATVPARTASQPPPCYGTCGQAEGSHLGGLLVVTVDWSADNEHNGPNLRNSVQGTCSEELSFSGGATVTSAESFTWQQRLVQTDSNGDRTETILSAAGAGSATTPFAATLAATGGGYEMSPPYRSLPAISAWHWSTVTTSGPGQKTVTTLSNVRVEISGCSAGLYGSDVPSPSGSLPAGAGTNGDFFLAGSETGTGTTVSDGGLRYRATTSWDLVACSTAPGAQPAAASGSRPTPAFDAPAFDASPADQASTQIGPYPSVCPPGTYSGTDCAHMRGLAAYLHTVTIPNIRRNMPPQLATEEVQAAQYATRIHHDLAQAELAELTWQVGVSQDPTNSFLRRQLAEARARVQEMKASLGSAEDRVVAAKQAVDNWVRSATSYFEKVVQRNCRLMREKPCTDIPSPPC